MRISDQSMSSVSQPAGSSKAPACLGLRVVIVTTPERVSPYSEDDILCTWCELLKMKVLRLWDPNPLRHSLTLCLRRIHLDAVPVMWAAAWRKNRQRATLRMVSRQISNESLSNICFTNKACKGAEIEWNSSADTRKLGNPVGWKPSGRGFGRR